ncbi:hypothetical protein PVAND_008459 [Polypedilum vanderplanki]|uniref:MD-2-related lipid-recognition domain-containing protein n=1 Tax=Polypedilum vanderplanki TaxID=319348 RepID=A0A9J6C9P5_POLVA|nr:hypothetical protein PVAND_008459 [Polypedilum vanderplanki]
MIKFFVLFTFFVYSVNANFWSGCFDLPNAIIPTEITSDQCSDTKCIIKRGEPLMGHVAFTFLKEHEYLKVAVKGTMYGTKIDLYDFKENICDMIYDKDDNFFGCPTETDVESGWKLKFRISSIFPAYSNAVLRFELKEENNTEVCFEIIADVL